MPASPAQAFEAELKRRQQAQARTALAAERDVLAALEDAKAAILARLADQPTEFEQWRLAQLLVELQTVLDAATGQMGTRAVQALGAAWQEGIDLVRMPLTAAGALPALPAVHSSLNYLHVPVLQALGDFVEGRLKDVSDEAMRTIRRELALVGIGAKNSFAAIKAVNAVLGGSAMRRATTIVRTELARGRAISAQRQMEADAALMAETSGRVLQKQWRRSGKIHSRWNHDAIDGAVVDVGQPFVLPTLNGAVKMLHPHDPAAPAEEVINCGCEALAYVKGWQIATPGAKPFTDLEIKLDGRKGLLDQMAKRVGLRS